MREEANPVAYGALPGRFTGGVLVTKDIPALRFDQGRFEIRCRFPHDGAWLGHGLWPAFWLIGGECGREEIDVFELTDVDANHNDWGTVYTTLHGIANGLPNPNSGIDCREACIGATPGFIKTHTGYNNLMDGSFHTFAVEWEPACITWFVDGAAVLTHYRFFTQTGQVACGVPAGSYFQHPVWPYHPLQVIVDMKLGRQATNDPPGRVPANLDVDYVRVYQRIPASDPKNLCGGTLTGPNQVCAGDSYTAAFRSPTSSITWTCSPNLTISGTGNIVTASPVAGATPAVGWIKAEPIFQGGILCTATDAVITKNVWVGPPATPAILSASIRKTADCFNFSVCPALPGAGLAGNSYRWEYSPSAYHRGSGGASDSTSTAQTAPRPAPVDPLPGNDCPTCPVVSSQECINGSWSDYPGANASVNYRLTVTNRCGAVTVAGTIYRPLSNSNPCPATNPNPPSQPKYFYPNPADDWLVVEGANAPFTGHLAILSSKGTAMFSAELDTTDLRITTSGFESGKYLLQIKNDDFIIQDTLVINHSAEPAKPYFWPNPVDDKLTVAGAAAPTAGKLYLYDMYGTARYSGNLAAQDEILDVSAFPSGTYLLVIQGASLTTHDRVIIDHGQASSGTGY